MNRAIGDQARTAVELWTKRVAVDGAKIAFRFKEDGSWQSLTWAEADARARQIAAGLAAAGVGAGDRVCLLSQTRVEWMLADIGILLTGAVTVPIYASNPAEQCAYIIRDSGARLAIVEDAAQLEKILAIRSHTPSLSRVVHIAGDAELERPDATGRTHVRLADVRPQAGAYVQSLAELREAGRSWQKAAEGVLAKRLAAVRPETPFTIIYTSGTTAQPKGVILSHENLTAALASACRHLTLLPEDEQLLFLPLAHVLGRELAWIPVQAGITTWYAESLANLKDSLAEARPTFMAGVPRVYEKLYGGVKTALGQGSTTKRTLIRWALRVGERTSRVVRGGRAPGALLAAQNRLADRLVFSKLRARLGLSRCRFLVSGGAPLAPAIAEFFHGVGLLILEGYGLTETMAASHLNRLRKFRFGTVGEALDIVETKIADDGEVLVRGPSVFRAYHNKPDATAEAVDGDGWFHTGDIGELQDGFLRITDRKKDLIVTAGGKKVAPQPIENAIKAQTPFISQVLVVGDRRPFCAALVTPSEEALKHFGAGDAPELRQQVERAIAAVNAKLASFESVKTFAVLQRDLTESAGEMTPSLKVKRKVVLERYRDVVEAMYEGAAAAARA